MSDAARDLLHRRIAVAEEICGFAASLAVQANVGIRERGLQLRRKDSVLIGLALKIDSSFRALIDDCKAERSEAMHHLKTMAECLIYFYAVLQDPSDATERRLLAKAFHEEARFFKDNPGEGDASEVTELEALRDRLLAGPPPVAPLPNLETLAKAPQVGVGGWYSRVYRMACEPAHIGDLLEYMPEDGVPIRLGAPGDFAPGRAREAIWYGSQIVLAVMRSICEHSELGLQVPVDELERSLRDAGNPDPGATA